MSVITEDFVSFEVAKLLKEKGFDAECRAAYTNYGKLFTTQIQQYITNVLCSKGYLWDYTAPTLQMAMKWLREVHNIDIIAPPQFDNSKWTYSAIIFKLSIPCTEIRFNDNKYKKEEAYEAAIKYCLENLI